MPTGFHSGRAKHSPANSLLVTDLASIEGISFNQRPTVGLTAHILGAILHRSFSADAFQFFIATSSQLIHPCFRRVSTIAGRCVFSLAQHGRLYRFRPCCKKRAKNFHPSFWCRQARPSRSQPSLIVIFPKSTRAWS
jgi:hypothetical protein